MKNKIYNQLSEKYVDVEGKRIARVPSNINYIKENHHPTYNFIKSFEDNKNDIQDYRLLTNRSTACFLTEIKSLKWYNISIQRRF